MPAVASTVIREFEVAYQDMFRDATVACTSTVIKHGQCYWTKREPHCAMPPRDTDRTRKAMLNQVNTRYRFSNT